MTRKGGCRWPACGALWGLGCQEVWRGRGERHRGFWKVLPGGPWGGPDLGRGRDWAFLLWMWPARHALGFRPGPICSLI